MVVHHFARHVHPATQRFLNDVGVTTLVTVGASFAMAGMAFATSFVKTTMDERRTQHQTNLLFHAIAEGDLEEVKRLLSLGAFYVDATNYNGYTCLHIASQEGHSGIVFALIKGGAHVNTAIDNNGSTPLHYAVSTNGHVGVVAELIKGGAHLNAVTNNGSTPLHCACQKGHIRIMVESIKSGANVNAFDDDGDTPLIRACIDGRLDVVEELLKDRELKLCVVNKKGPGSS